ncbi:MAG: hypothetical protein C3F06_01145 [Candidatus Methanoperedenaceae archaeon]|nr:MAG: hypothetical protein C3F06_01145 [Candidatus Methanoperedenaceae archaeon]
MSESTWIERFYTHFLGRDLTYIYAGGLFICVVEYALYYTNPIPQELSPNLIGFILSSYFLGFSIREIGLKLFPLRKKAFDKTDLFFHQKLIKKYDSKILDKYERMIYSLAIFTSVGTSSLLSGGFMLLVGLYRWFLQAIHSIDYIGLALGLVLLGRFLVNDGIKLARYLEEQDEALADDMLSENR